MGSADDAISSFGALLSRAMVSASEGAALILGAISNRGPKVVDEVAGRLEFLAKNLRGASLEQLSAALFQGEGALMGNRVDFYDSRNSMIDQVLARRIGIPITLSVVFMDVAARAGIDIVGVAMPAHFVCGEGSRLDEIPERFVDCFNGGRILDRDGCRDLFRSIAGPTQPFDIRYLRPVPTMAILERMLNNLKSIYIQREMTGELRTVMRLRAQIPGLGKVESDEFRRLMAPLN